MPQSPVKARHFPSPLGPSLRPLLKRVGLEDKEIEVYLALLPLKKARATSIAKAAKQSRSHTYLVLRSLERKGLVSELNQGNIIHFVAEPPQRLLTYVEDREQELKGLIPVVEGALPYLQSVTKPLQGEPRITLSHGMEGMKQVYKDMLTQDFVSFFNPQLMFEAFGGNIVSMFFPASFKLRGRDLLVDNDGSRRYISEVPQSEEYKIRVLPRGITYPTEMLVAGDTVAIYAYDDDETIIQIENHNIAESFRSWFEAMWGMAREP